MGTASIVRGVVKKRIFYGQADRKGGAGVGHLGPDCKQLWKFWPIFSVEYDSAIPLPDRFVTEQQQQ